MSTIQWEHLKSRSFGEIIFSNKSSNDDGIGLPTLINDGDLDGDLYYVCWDENIVQNVSQKLKLDSTIEITERNQNKVKIEESTTTSSNTDTPDNWLEMAQNYQIDPNVIKGKKMIAKLYKEKDKIFNESTLKDNDPDYILLAKAYKEAIDGQKHGGGTNLPCHLRKRLGL